MSGLVERIGVLIAEHGSLRAAARWLHCDPGYLSRLQSGEKNDPGPRLLLSMDLRQTISYARIERPDAGVFDAMFSAPPAPAYTKDGNTAAMLRVAGLGAVQAIEPSPAPVQPETNSAHFNSRDWHLLITALNEVAGSNAWQGEHFANDLMTPAVAAIRALHKSVQPQAEPVAAADKLDADRYRWLRSTTQRIVNRHGDKVDVTPEIMDSTIDDNILAAMKGTP